MGQSSRCWNQDFFLRQYAISVVVKSQLTVQEFLVCWSVVRDALRVPSSLKVVLQGTVTSSTFIKIVFIAYEGRILSPSPVAGNPSAFVNATTLILNECDETNIMISSEFHVSIALLSYSSSIR